MGKHKRKPPVFAGNVARQAQARYLRTKKPESERVQENREAAGHVICLCFMVALNDRYGIGEGRLQRVTDAANGELERFAINQRAVGMERAKKLLNETLAGLYDGNFVLPITKSPKKARDWAMLGEQRRSWSSATHWAHTRRWALAGSAWRRRSKPRKLCSVSLESGQRAGTSSGTPCWQDG